MFTAWQIIFEQSEIRLPIMKVTDIVLGNPLIRAQ